MKRVTLYDGERTIFFDDDEHAYFSESELGGEPIPVDGVTGILKRVFGWSPQLAWWQMTCAVNAIQAGYLQSIEDGNGFLEPSAFEALCKQSLTASKRVSKTATDVGTRCHKFGQHYKDGDQPPEDDDPQYVNGCQAICDWFTDNRVESIYKERIVFSPKHWFAGTCDRFARINGELAVADFKTSKPFKTDWKGPYLDMIYQLAAYAIALEEEFPDESIEAGYIIRLDKATGKCDPHRVRLTPQVKRGWLLIRALEKEKGLLERGLTREALS